MTFKIKTTHIRLACLLLAASLAMACDKAADTSDEPQAIEVAPAPEPIQVAANASGLFFRYVDPATGLAASATTIEAIPETARAEVVVYQDSAPPPPGWDHVADLRKLPTTTSPRQGFNLKTVRIKRAAVAAAGGNGKEVVMFVRNGCGFCAKAGKWLTAKKINFEKLNLDHDPAASKRLSKLARSAGLPQSKLNGVPIIFVDGKPIVGFDRPRLAKLLGK